MRGEYRWRVSRERERDKLIRFNYYVASPNMCPGTPPCSSRGACDLTGKVFFIAMFCFILYNII